MTFTRRRALASIVTSAILLSSIAILGVGLVGWSNSNLLSHQKNLENTFSKNINKLNEHTTFEKIWFGGTTPNKFVNVTLTNTGNVGLNVTQIKFVNSSDSTEILSSTVSDGGIQVSESYSSAINYEWSSGTAFDIIVTTGRDTLFRTQVSP
jgi:archaellum component FlaF (FlaF/FlaG flagellin family)